MIIFLWSISTYPKPLDLGDTFIIQRHAWHNKMVTPSGTFMIEPIFVDCVYCVVLYLCFILFVPYFYLLVTWILACILTYCSCINTSNMDLYLHAFKFWECKPNFRLGGGLSVCLMTFNRGSNSWDTQLWFENLLGNDYHTCPQSFLVN